MLLTALADQALIARCENENVLAAMEHCSVVGLWTDRFELALEEYLALSSHDEEDNATVPDDSYAKLLDLITLAERVYAGGACPTEERVRSAGQSRGHGTLYFALGVTIALGGAYLYWRNAR